MMMEPEELTDDDISDAIGEVTNRVGGGIKTGSYINGLIRVHLNHPASPSKDVMFNGFVR